MKSIMPFFIAIYLLASTIASAQSLNTSPDPLIVSGAPNTVVATTVTGVGLSPAVGAIEVVPDSGFLVSLDSVNWDYVTIYIPYTGGTLNPTKLYMQYSCPAAWGWGVHTITGGGATLSVCMCINAGPSCPCLIAAGFTEAAINTGLSFYPNPAHSHLIFDGDVHSILIIDVTGREMYRNEDDKYITRHIKQLDISAYPTGVYLIRLNNGEMQKFVKE